MRANNALAPISGLTTGAPGTAKTDGRNQDQSLNLYNSGLGPSTDDDMASAGQGPNKINIVAKKRPPPMAIGFNESGIEMSRQVLYRNFHQINDVVYLCEISRNPRKVFILLFPNFEKPEEYI